MKPGGAKPSELPTAAAIPFAFPIDGQGVISEMGLKLLSARSVGWARVAEYRIEQGADVTDALGRSPLDGALGRIGGCGDTPSAAVAEVLRGPAPPRLSSGQPAPRRLSSRRPPSDALAYQLLLPRMKLDHPRRDER